MPPAPVPPAPTPPPAPPAPDPDGLLLQVTLVYLIAVVAAALVSGARSDRSLRRKPYVVASSALIAVAGPLAAAVLAHTAG